VLSKGVEDATEGMAAAQQSHVGVYQPHDIVRTLGGWSIVCDGIARGMPYLRREVALQDATWSADLLAKAGEDVEIYLSGERVDYEKKTRGRH
jgi:hypothetical protein